MTCEWPDGSGGAGLKETNGGECDGSERRIHRNEEMRSDKWEKHPEER